MNSNQPSPAIEIHDLVVIRGQQTIISGLDLTIPRGVITGLLGPSGCGKTTLMRCIVGVQLVRSGDVTVLDEPAGSSSLRRRVGYVTQAPSVYVDLSVGENLAYFARILAASRDGIERALNAVGLADRVAQLVSTLSSGERSRVSLAVALLAEPDLLVLDEPTVGLDPLLRRQLWATFHGLAAGGTTLLVSSHVLDEAERCDEIILMREGAVIAHSTPAELLVETGANDIEAAFLRATEKTTG